MTLRTLYLNDVKTIRECFELRDGILHWRARPAEHFVDPHRATRFNTRFAGKPVSTPRTQDYPQVRITIRGKRECALAHRVIWALAYGRMPFGDIDHINGDPLDNRLSNLREVSHEENQRNTALRRDNPSGVAGVKQVSQRPSFEARITCAGRIITRTFATFEQAVSARRAWEREFGFHENHGTRRSHFFRRRAAALKHTRPVKAT